MPLDQDDLRRKQMQQFVDLVAEGILHSWTERGVWTQLAELIKSVGGVSPSGGGGPRVSPSVPCVVERKSGKITRHEKTTVAQLLAEIADTQKLILRETRKRRKKQDVGSKRHEP